MLDCSTIERYIIALYYESENNDQKKFKKTFTNS